MNLFQLIMLLSAGVIFYLFFKQILSEDFHQEKSKKSDISPNRLEELLEIAKESLKNRNYLEAQKALQSALILAPDHPDILRMLGVSFIGMNNYLDAKKTYQKLLEINPNDDLAHSSLANVLHQLGEDEEAIKHHKIAIELDRSYAPHYFNYANTLYDLRDFKEAKEAYRRAFELDPSLKEAKEMFEKLN